MPPRNNGLKQLPDAGCSRQAGRVTGNLALIEFISGQIARSGPVTFRWFMDQALYHRALGYYASGKAAIGRRGDFFTNVSVGALFGELLAAQFHEMWMRMDRSSPFTIVEQGANNGSFARDVLSSLKTHEPDFFHALNYIIVEPFQALQERQQEKLAPFGNVSWRESIAGLKPFSGVHFSNELIDAMPVHLVRFAGASWHERYVNERFELIDGPLSTNDLSHALQHLPRIEDYQTEVNRAAPVWIDELSSKLARGYLLAIDYGHSRDIFYRPERNRGTLACYSAHRRGEDPLALIGETDITAHVEFTSLVERAEASGFDLAGFTDQHHFMVGLGKRAFPDTSEAPTEAEQKRLRAYRTLMHPQLMGLSFKVLALQKGIPNSEPLQGFQFATDPRHALGLAGRRIP